MLHAWSSLLSQLKNRDEKYAQTEAMHIDRRKMTDNVHTHVQAIVQTESSTIAEIVASSFLEHA